MGVKLMSQAFSTSLPTSQKMVLLVLCDFANDDGLSCHPSIAKVARKASVSDRQCKRLIRDLEALGVVSVVGNNYGGKPGSTRHYQINVQRLLALSTGDTHDTGDNLSRVTDEAGRGDTDDTPGVTNGAQTGDTHVTQPPIDPPVEPPKTPQGARAKFDPKSRVPKPLDADTWEQFCDHRKSIGKTIRSERPITLIENDFAKTGLTAAQAQACVLDSIKNGYQGVFPHKFTTYKPPKGRSPSDFTNTDYTEGVTADGRLC